MKTKNHFLVLVIAVVIFPAFVLAADKAASPDKGAISIWVNPAFSGLDGLSVFVAEPYLENDPDPGVWARLEKNIKKKISTSNPQLKKLIGNSRKNDSGLPQLQIVIDNLNPDGKTDLLFRVETSLMVEFVVDRQQKQALEAKVWGLCDTARVSSAKLIPTAVSGVALKHTDEFIKKWLAANPEFNVTPPKLTPAKKPNDKDQPVQFKFVASKNSRVFHLPSCRFAGRIKPQNLISYKTRGEALKDGKRPCKRCKP